jgi:hypothetical protein
VRNPRKEKRVQPAQMFKVFIYPITIASITGNVQMARQCKSSILLQQISCTKRLLALAPKKLVAPRHQSVPAKEDQC